MIIEHHQAFATPNRNRGLRPVSFDRHLAARLLVSIYANTLREPLPDRLDSLVRALEAREAVRDR
jgi:hypothetical protein